MKLYTTKFKLFLSSFNIFCKLYGNHETKSLVEAHKKKNSKHATIETIKLQKKRAKEEERNKGSTKQPKTK
jgi:hypothetical protein